MEKATETLQSRKFWITVLIIAAAITLFITGQIEIDRMTDMIKWAAGVYVGALSIEDAAKKVVEYLK